MRNTEPEKLELEQQLLDNNAEIANLKDRLSTATAREAILVEEVEILEVAADKEHLRRFTKSDIRSTSEKTEEGLHQEIQSLENIIAELRKEAMDL